MPGMLKPDLRMVLRELRRSLLHHRAGAQVLGLANADRSGDDSRRLIGREVAEVPAVEVYKARMMEKLGCRTLADVVRAGSELAVGRA